MNEQNTVDQLAKPKEVKVNIGMSRRDYLTGMALQALIANKKYHDEFGRFTEEQQKQLQADAVKFADGLISLLV